MDAHNEILAKIDRDYFAVDQQRDWTNEDLRFCDVDGAMYDDWFGDQFQHRPKMEFNKVAQAVHRFSGEWASNRFDVRFKPDDGVSSDDDAELLNGLYRKDFRRSNGAGAVDNAVIEMGKGGYSAYKLATEFVDEEDPENDQQRIIWKPIHNAYSSVIFDANAKEYDKADAKHVTHLELLTREAAVEEWGEKVCSAFSPPDQRRFQWNNQASVWIGHYYEIKIEKVEAILFEGPLGRKKTVYADEFKDYLDDLADGGFEEVKRRKIKRKTVWKTIVDGSGILEEAVRIPGKLLPIVPMYGFRGYIDGQEYWYGIVRKMKDANRLFNMSATSVAENAATSQKDMPVFTDEQVEGRETELSEMHLGKYNHVVINAVEDEQGNTQHLGPVGTWGASRVDPNNAAIMQIAADFIREETGGNPQDVLNPDASGKAIQAVQQRVDMQTFILMDNVAKSLRRGGDVYRSMAAEVYDSERVASVINQEGGEDTTILFDVIIDEESGQAKFINDVTKGVFESFVDTGPAFASRKRETVETLKDIATVAPESYQPFIFAELINNIDGVGLDGLKEFNKQQMLIQGLRKPESEEEKQLVEQMQSQQSNSQEELMQAATQQQLAEAEEKRSNAQKNATQSQLNLAKAAETINGIKISRFKMLNDVVERRAERAANF